MASVDMSIVTAALPLIERDLGLSTNTAEWVVLAYLLPLGRLWQRAVQRTQHGDRHVERAPPLSATTGATTSLARQLAFAVGPALATLAKDLSSYRPESVTVPVLVATACSAVSVASLMVLRPSHARHTTRQRQNPQGGTPMPENTTDLVSVRYLVDDVAEAVDYYTSHLGFTVRNDFAPAFADVVRDRLRLLLSGPTSSAGRPMPDGAMPGPGGWNRIHLIVPDIAAEVARLRGEGLNFRNDIVTGPGGQQILLEDPSHNVVELFQPAEN